MPKYVALLRGIGPSNPNMHNDKLRGCFEQLGFTNVQTVISSGNVIFESPQRDAGALEEMIEAALPQQLGFSSATLVRSRAELQELVDKNPFKGMEHSQKTYLTVTFLKKIPEKKLSYPPDKPYKLIGLYDRAICSIADLTAPVPADLMGAAERELGKSITTRTWKTVERILKKMG